MQETPIQFLGWKDPLEKGIGYPLQHSSASLVAQKVKNPPAMQETWVRSLSWEDSPGGGHGNPLQHSCCRKGDSFQGPKVGSCLTLRTKLSKETRVLIKQEILLGGALPGRKQEGKGTQENCCHMACIGFYGDGISFRVVSGQSFWLRVLPGGTCIAQPRWMPARRILGGGWTHSVTFWPFSNSSCWWWLISSVKTAYANVYYGAWPVWVVSVSVLPLSFLAGESPWTEEPGRLLSTRSRRVGPNWMTKHSITHAFCLRPRAQFLCTLLLNWI